MANVIREDVVKLGFEVEGLKELTKLQDDVNELKKNLTGGIGDDAFEDLKKSANGAVNPIEKVKKATNDLKEKLTEVGNKAATKAYNGLKKIAGISFKAITAGIGAAAVGIGAIVTKATQAFADFEQLTGGVDTLFKDSAGVVKQYANEAYKTAGLSANEYMENVTGFSASLIASCGGDTAKAAELANTAIGDMSDNANKMGSDMGSLQTAYQGFAKQNYTMLDNLKLGYGGTKEEMSRLIKDAAKIDKSVDANSMSFGNIVKAINVVQKNMGIYGATAAEAEGTVSGSLGAMKSAWGNLITAIGSGENIDQCFDNFIKSAETFGKNIIPVIERALDGIVIAIDKLAPVIADKLPDILIKVIPKLISAAGKVVGALIKALPSIIKSLIPAIKEAAAEVVKALYEAFTGKEMSADTFEGVKSTINGLCKAIEVALPLVLALVAAFKAYQVVKKIVGGITKFAKGISTIAQKVAGGLATKMTDVADGMKKTGTSAKTSGKDMLQAALAFLMIAAAVLLVAVGFALLAQSSIALASAGWGAIAVMLGMVAAVVALGYGMMILLKSLSTMGMSAMQGALAMLLLGVALVLVAAGFAILTFCAIALANAGGAAIAVFFGMIIAVAALAIVVAVLGSAMLTGAIGFLVFGAAVLLVGAGFMLMGVGALLSAMALSIIVGLLPQVIQHGLLGAVVILALGAALLVFSAGALLAGVAAIVLGAGLLVIAAALLVMVVPLMLIMVSTMLLAAILPMISTQLLLIMATTLILSVTMSLLCITTVLLTTTLLLLMTTMLILTPLLLLFSVALLPLSVAMLAVTVTVVLFTYLMKKLMKVFVTLAPASKIVATSMQALKPAFSSLQKSVPKFTKTLKPLREQFVELALPAMQVATAILPISLAFALLAVSSTALLTNIMALAAAFMLLASVITTIVTLIKVEFASMAVALQISGMALVKIMSQIMKKLIASVDVKGLKKAGAQMINGLILGMNSRKKAAISTARAIAQAINREYRKVQDIHSPSGEWEDYGANQIQGDINGMKNKMPQLKSTVQDVGEMSMPYTGHYTPENTTSYSNSRNTEYNTYSPQFNFSASGTSDDRAMLRKMKRMFTEAWEDMLDGYESKTPKVQEI